MPGIKPGMTAEIAAPTLRFLCCRYPGFLAVKAIARTE
jgi:hypothetical protein